MKAKNESIEVTSYVVTLTIKSEEHVKSYPKDIMNVTITPLGELNTPLLCTNSTEDWAWDLFPKEIINNYAKYQKKHFNNSITIITSRFNN